MKETKTFDHWIKRENALIEKKTYIRGENIWILLAREQQSCVQPDPLSNAHER